MVLLFALVTIVSFSQTRVSGYYRKNGTYVSSYTRGGSSHSSSSSYSSGTSNTDETPKEEIKQSTLKIDDNGFNVYVSVLKYNNQVIDVQQIERKYNWYGFDKKDSWSDVKYSFDSKQLTQEEILKIVSDYGWYLKDGILSKTQYLGYSTSKFELPNFLSQSFEILKVK